MDFQKLYTDNFDFKGYVDAYCREYGYTADEAITHAIVRSVGMNYAEKSAKDDFLEEKKGYGC